MLMTLAIAGYRSIRDLVLPLARLTVITGANGAGKSSLYRSMRLLSDTANGRIIASLAREGGLGSTMWAGPESFSAAVKRGRHPVQGTVRRQPLSLKIGFSSEDYGYAIDLGLPIPQGDSMFNLDPQIKAESLWIGETLSRHNEVARRSGSAVAYAEPGKKPVAMGGAFASSDSMLLYVPTGSSGLEVLALRERIRGWRFYDHFRTDPDAPLRQPQIGIRTPVLASDGRDIAAAVQTIREIGDHASLDAAIEAAFPGCTVTVDNRDGLFHLIMHQPGVLRPLGTAELSDGTLRYLLLCAALLSPRPPELMVLNEPESDLHSDLLLPLATLIRQASATSQIIVVTHNAPLATALARDAHCRAITLEKRLGETVAPAIAPMSWSWPSR